MLGIFVADPRAVIFLHGDNEVFLHELTMVGGQLVALSADKAIMIDAVTGKGVHDFALN